VVVSSRKADACAEVARSIEDNGGTAMVVPCNISYKEQLQQLVDATIARWGGIDILVCNAAVNPHFGPAASVPDEAYEKIMGSNVRSNFWLSNMVCAQMAERGGGSIVIVSSIGGLQGSDTLGVYSLSKAADMQMARNIAVEWGARKVRANCIAPGLIRTDFARKLWEDADTLRKFTRGAALERIGEADEIAGAAVFLASAAGAFMTGQTLVIDGGVTIKAMAGT
jgi:NAD(P)-dependent dehydrogenase (short-subunit alcohol dehydrogenase family)